MGKIDKTVAEVAWEAIKSNKLFKKITVYGLLIDYKTNTAQTVQRMIVDYNNKKTTIYEVHEPSLSIKEAIERVTSNMDRC